MADGVTLRSLRKLSRADAFLALFPLFRHSHDPFKELTESASALEHLRPFLREGDRVLHVGDGARCHTAALFAFMTKTDNLAIDPDVNEARVREWRNRYQVQRFAWRKARVEDCYPLTADAVTFVHAHVDTAEVLRQVRGWRVAFTLACCSPGRQLVRGVPSAEDPCVLSPQRTFQIITPSDVFGEEVCCA